MVKYSEALEITHPHPCLGPFPLGHHLGLLQVMVLLMRSMEKGTGPHGTVKWGTTRKKRGTYTVVWDASPDARADIAHPSSLLFLLAPMMYIDISGMLFWSQSPWTYSDSLMTCFQTGLWILLECTHAQ